VFAESFTVFCLKLTEVKHTKNILEQDGIECRNWIVFTMITSQQRRK